MSQAIRLHLPAIPYTITRPEFSHDAFTGKVLRFPKAMISRGFEVYHYGVETSETGATQQIELMSKEEWTNFRLESIMYLNKTLTREQAIIKNNDPTLIISEFSNWSTPLAKEFNRRFREKLGENYRGRKTDIVCLPLGRMHEAGIQGLSCTAVEIGIGYSGSFTDFRIFEAYSWMSRTLGVEKKQPQNYWFVVPHAFDINEFKLSLKPVPKRIGFLGRITNLKGCGIIKEIAKRFPDTEFILCGQGDPAPFLDVPNIIYKSPIHGEERSDFLGSCTGFLHLAKYLEPFGCGPVEAQLCGTPVICSDWGGMAETVEQGLTGLRGHTLADYCHGVQMALDGKFDRSYIRKRATDLFDMYKLAPRYEYIFKSIIDIYTPGKNGWYSPDTHIAPAVSVATPAKPWIETPIRPATANNIRIHVPAIPYTITRPEYSHDAYTGKVLRFPRAMMSRGFEVYHYGVETSETGATKHIDLMSKEEWTNLRIKTWQFLNPALTLEEATKKNEDQTNIVSELSNWNSPLTLAFNARFREKLIENHRGNKTDIVCIPLVKTYEKALEGLGYTVVESGIGYEGSKLAYRIFESYAWMSRTLGVEDKQPNNYWFVIPNFFDTTEFKLSLNPVPKRIGFLGRLTGTKGCGIIVEIAKRFPHVEFILCGSGNPKDYLTQPNIVYKEPIHGEERSEYLGSCTAVLCLSKFLEPFCGVAVEAQLCGTPVICSDWGGMAETVEQGRTGIRGHTIADYCYGVQMALDGKFDRSYIRKRAANLFDMYKLAENYEYALKTILDVHTPGKNGWYSPDTHILPLMPTKKRIFICIPYYGAFPNYFQLYLDSAGMNADILAVILITDIDTSSYTVPANVFVYKMPRQDVQKRVAKFIKDVYDKTIAPENLLKDNYKFVDFKIVYPILFADIFKELGASPQDFVGWGDIDIIYGKLSNFIRLEEGYGILGGWHGHFTAIVNDEEFKYNFKTIPNYLELITDNSKTFITDEIAYREPLKAYLARKSIKVFYTNAWFCDIVPPCFYDRFRKDHSQRKKNFFDVYNSTKDITNLFYNKELSRLTVYYDDGSSRETLYCHLQKRKMELPFHSYEKGYYINESRFSLESPIPKKIWQTWETVELPGALQSCVEEIKRQNPEFEHFLVDAVGRRAFIVEHFPKEFVVAYDCLKPGAYKADFWIYCVLYIHGGIYIDIKMKFAQGFTLGQLIGKEFFISDGTFVFEGQNTKSLFNGFMLCKKGSPILLYSIINIIYNVRYNILGNNPWHPTGPQLLGTNYRRSKNTAPIDYYFYNGHICKHDGTPIAQTLMNYTDIYRNCEKTKDNYYVDLWNKRCIYEKCEIELEHVYKNSLWPKEFLNILEEFMPLDINVIMRGHFRTFHSTSKSWERALSSCRHEVYMHTWDTVDSDTKTWYSNTGANTSKLLKEDIELLHRFDEGCVIEGQVWTEEERQAIVLSRPFKTFLYYWQGIHSCINRIKRESKYILIGRYDVSVDIDFSSVSCEEGEIVIGYMYRVPSNPFTYSMTDVVFLINTKDKDKLLDIPPNILELEHTANPNYKWAEDPITEFFYTRWKKVTPKWFGTKDFIIIR